ASYGIGQLTHYVKEFGLGAWCYIDSAGRYLGLTQPELSRACANAQFLLSIWSTTWVSEFMECRNRIYIDTDPGFTQFTMKPFDQTSKHGYASPYDFHHHFTYGTRIGLPDCPIP